MQQPTIMSAASFISNTTRAGAIKRSSLGTITNLLAGWPFKRFSSTNSKIQHLSQICVACTAWQAAKAHKIANGPNQSANTVARNVHVTAVANQAATMIKYIRFEEAKANRMPHVPAAVANQRTLRPGHANERLVYAANKAGGNKTANFPGGSMIADQLAQRRHYYVGAPQGIQDIVAPNRGFADLNQQEFEDLGAYTVANMLNVMPEVHYSDKAERISEHMLFVQGGLLRKFPGQNYNSAVPARDMWAMDRYGNFMCTAANAGANGAQYNHSSLNAGHNVLCAGVVVIQNGVITHIDNNSGHYQPTLANLTIAVGVLHHDLGASFAPNVVIESHAPPQKRRWNQLQPFLINDLNQSVVFV